MKLHNEELHNLYSPPNIIWQIKSRRVRWAEREVIMGEKKVCKVFFVAKSEGRKPLGRSRRRWKDEIRMDFREIG
jgi:hypothetical protein